MASSSSVQPRRVALIGHSYVSRLRAYMVDNRCQNLNFPPSSVRVQTFGRGGAGLRVLPDGRWATRLLQDALLFHPSIVFIHLGENDLNHLFMDSLVDHVTNYVRSIITLSHPNVIIVSQLFPMPNHTSRHNITSINEALSAACDTLNQFPSVIAGHSRTRVVFLRYRFGIWGRNSASFFDTDGIHLTELGMRHYFHSVHNAVGSAITSL